MRPGRSGGPAPAPGWRVAQVACLLGLVAAPVVIMVRPDLGLPLFWRVLVPLLPILFLLNPSIWRNVCPLATVGMGPAPAPLRPVLQGSRSPGEGGLVAGIVLLLALIPLRHAGLEQSVLASTGLLVLAGGGALVSRRRSRKAGFCNGWCPILPVERLYGQAPLLEVENVRCPTCTTCTARGCIDLSNRAAQAQLLGPARHTAGWLSTPGGIFAGAFPGVILAFSLAAPEPAGLAAAGRQYLFLTTGGLTSWLMVSAAVRATGAGWRSTVLTLGCLAAGIYLWFALPLALETVLALTRGSNGTADPSLAGVTGTSLLRAGAVSLCGASWWRGRRRIRSAGP